MNCETVPSIQNCTTPTVCVSLSRSLLAPGGDASRAAEGPDAGDRFSTNRPSLHQVRAEAVQLAVQFRGELHKRDGVQVFRHERVRVGPAHEVSTGRGRDVVALSLSLLSLFRPCILCSSPLILSRSRPVVLFVVFYFGVKLEAFCGCKAVTDRSIFL